MNIVIPPFRYLNTLYPDSVFSGNLIFVWLLSQSNDVEKKAEQGNSHVESNMFLRQENIVCVFDRKCINAITTLQHSLQTNESKLVDYVRKNTKNCMEAMTTFPVEVHKHVIEHSPFEVNANMNLNESIRQIINGIQKGLRRSMLKPNGVKEITWRQTCLQRAFSLSMIKG